MSLTEVNATPPEPSEVPEGAFSQVLRERTAAVHEAAETSPLMSALMAGTMPRSAYAQLVGQLFFVYDAIDSVAADLRDDAVVGPFCAPALDRRTAFASDLAVLLGDDWRAGITPLDSTTEYAARVRTLGRDWPGGYIGHHYTRYMGDLSGGVFIGGAVRRTYDLTETYGASIYTFAEIESAKAFKGAYRELLDAAPWDASEQVAIVDEIVSAYGRNTTLFHDVWTELVEPTLDS